VDRLRQHRYFCTALIRRTLSPCTGLVEEQQAGVQYPRPPGCNWARNELHPDGTVTDQSSTNGTRYWIRRRLRPKEHRAARNWGDRRFFGTLRFSAHPHRCRRRSYPDGIGFIGKETAYRTIIIDQGMGTPPASRMWIN
jgi:hypothetical protein